MISKKLVVALGLVSMISIAKPKPVTIHIAPHSHDDVGWRITVDQYFDGSRKDI